MSDAAHGGVPLGPVDPGQLSRIAARRNEAAVVLDFDGTLAPIVADPNDARPLPGAPEVLAALGARFKTVAVISGRPVAVLRDRLGTPAGVRLIGLYGVEQLIEGSLQVHRDAARQRDAVRDAAEALEASLRDLTGVAVERKGLSVAVHFRRAPDPAAAQARAEPVVREVAARIGIGAVRQGRLVLEIGPGVAVDKGSTARDLLAASGIQAVLAAGDDAGDAEMFHAAGELPFALRIAVLSAEAPRALLEAADAAVSGPQELLEVLSALVRAAGP